MRITETQLRKIIRQKIQEVLDDEKRPRWHSLGEAPPIKSNKPQAKAPEVEHKITTQKLETFENDIKALHPSDDQQTKESQHALRQIQLVKDKIANEATLVLLGGGGGYYLKLNDTKKLPIASYIGTLLSQKYNKSLYEWLKKRNIIK
jgi:hypothetical protein